MSASGATMSTDMSCLSSFQPIMHGAPPTEQNLK